MSLAVTARKECPMGFLTRLLGAASGGFSGGTGALGHQIVLDSFRYRAPATLGWLIPCPLCREYGRDQNTVYRGDPWDDTRVDCAGGGCGSALRASRFNDIIAAVAFAHAADLPSAQAFSDGINHGQNGDFSRAAASLLLCLRRGGRELAAVVSLTLM